MIRRNDIPVILTTLLILLTGILISVADDEGLNLTENQTQNATQNLTDMEYVDGDASLSMSLGVSPLGSESYATAGRISTGISGSSITGSGDGQIPASVVHFSDKSSVSGFIKNFMKSFQYESGVDL